MLDLMRKHARNWIMKVLLGIIIVVFVFYFGSVGREQEARTLAVLKGRSLVYLNFQKEYSDLIELYRRQFGPNLSEELLKELNVKQQAFDNMIYKALALQKAEEWKITITDEELRQSIVNNQAFQRNGVFDQRLYEQALRLNRMTTGDFETSQKELLTISRLERILASAAAATERELRDIHALQNEEIALEAIVVSPAELQKSILPKREDLEKYFKEHGSLFRTGEQYQLEYLSFSAAEYEDKVKVTSAEIDAAYERANAGTRNQAVDAKGNNMPPAFPRERVLAELKQQKMLQAAQEAVRNAYEIIYQEEKLEKFARENGREIIKTDFFPLGKPVAALAGIPELAKTLTATQKGEITRVVSDNKAFFILKVLDKKAPVIPPFAEIEKDVEKKFIEQQAVIMARTAAEDIQADLKKGISGLQSLPLKGGMKRVETGYFRPGGAIPGLGLVSREMNDAIFTLSKKNQYPERSFVLADGSFVIIYLKDRRYITGQDFETSRDMLASQFGHMKSQELVSAFIEDYKNSLIKEGNLKIVKDVKDI